MVTLRGGSPPGLSNHPPRLPLALPLTRSLAGSSQRSSLLAHLSSTPAPAYAARGGRDRADPLLLHRDAHPTPRAGTCLSRHKSGKLRCRGRPPPPGAEAAPPADPRSRSRRSGGSGGGSGAAPRAGPAPPAARGAGRDPPSRSRCRLRRRGALRSPSGTRSTGRRAALGRGVGTGTPPLTPPGGALPGRHRTPLVTQSRPCSAPSHWLGVSAGVHSPQAHLHPPGDGSYSPKTTLKGHRSPLRRSRTGVTILGGHKLLGTQHLATSQRQQVSGGTHTRWTHCTAHSRGEHAGACLHTSGKEATTLCPRTAYTDPKALKGRHFSRMHKTLHLG